MNLNYDINLIMFNLLKNNNIYNIVFEKTNLGIEPVHTNKMLEYYLSDKECSLIYLRSFFENDFSDFKILQNNNYSNVFFEYITKKYSSNINDIIEIYKILFDNYSYPIKQNKIDSSFDNLLYFSLINLEKICSYTNNKILINNDINIIIPQKLRILFYNIIQLFYSILIKKNYEILYFNQRFFNDYLHRFILKHILFNKISTSSNYFLSKLNPIEKDKIDNILKNTLLCIDIANRLNWTNLPKKLETTKKIPKQSCNPNHKVCQQPIKSEQSCNLNKICQQPISLLVYLLCFSIRFLFSDGLDLMITNALYLATSLLV
jgi:hypothetical protein